MIEVTTVKTMIEVTIKYNLYTVQRVFTKEDKLLAYLRRKRKEHDKVVANARYNVELPFMKVSFTKL